MSRDVKAVLINPYEESVTDITYDASDYKNVYPLIRCSCFTVARLTDDDILIDDEGLLKVDNSTKFFKVNGYPQPLAGYGLVVGTDDEGETVSVTHDAKYYRQKIQFLDAEMIHVFGYFA